MPSTQRQATLQLDIVIVGAGLAGLASAYALAASGHRVRVFEKSKVVSTVPGGIRIPPNGTKILDDWGLHDELVQKSAQVESNSFIDMAIGELIGHTEWAHEMFKDSGGEFRCMRHEDLTQMLYRHAVAAGALFQFDAQVIGVSPAPDIDSSPSTPSIPRQSQLHPQPSITLSDGQEILADLVIGADGPRSLIRLFVDEDAGDVQETETGTTLYTGVLDGKTMMGNEHLKKLINAHFPVWMGDGSMAVAFPIGRDNSYAMHVYSPEEWPEGALDWELVASSNLRCDHLEPRVQSFLKNAKHLTRARWIERPPAEDWVDASERIILIGEAAHPLAPCEMHAGSGSLESAFVLSTLLSHLHSRSQLPSLLYAYQDLRSSRLARLHQIEMDNHMYLGLRAGEGKEERDTTMRAARLAAENGADANAEADDDGELDRQWGEMCEIWGYDARDDAEDWWVRWGLLRERASSLNDEAANLKGTSSEAGDRNSRFGLLEVRVNAV